LGGRGATIEDMNIAVLLYDGVTALDAIGPYEVLHRIPGVQIVFVGERAGEIVTDSKSLRLVATRSISETQAPDILVVPGGPGTRDLRKLEPLISWIRDVHERTQPPRPSAPARFCWARPESSMELKRQRTGQRWRVFGSSGRVR